jgi:hypothetical protein
MRPLLFALLVSAGRLAAQFPSTGRQAAPLPSTVILRAASSDTTEKLAALRTAGDTAWATVVNPRRDHFVAGGFPGREVRLLRRAGGWTVVATRSVVVPVSPLPSRPATPFGFSDTVPKRP